MVKPDPESPCSASSMEDVLVGLRRPSKYFRPPTHGVLSRGQQHTTPTINSVGTAMLPPFLRRWIEFLSQRLGEPAAALTVGTHQLLPESHRQQKIQRDRLMNDFSAALNNFQAVQRRAADKERESIARARAGSRLSEKLWKEDLGPITTQTEEVAITEEDLELIKERETNIRQLESDIMDVNQIFKDLAVMIHDQGEMIDSIEANVENAEVHVERGAEQLQRAVYYQVRKFLPYFLPLSVMSLPIIPLSLFFSVIAKIQEEDVYSSPGLNISTPI
uniref:Syntaxin 12 n=1 Tax=Fundulus heteroclitus TaxID=8078 RepID=A0A3Q2Q1Z0_FUNHE